VVLATLISTGWLTDPSAERTVPESTPEPVSKENWFFGPENWQRIIVGIRYELVGFGKGTHHAWVLSTLVILILDRLVELSTDTFVTSWMSMTFQVPTRTLIFATANLQSTTSVG
jgi:hypothetical protein